MSHFKNAIRNILNMMNNNNKNNNVKLIKIQVNKLETTTFEHAINFASSLFTLYGCFINSFTQTGFYYEFESDYIIDANEQVERIETEKYVLYFIY